MKKFISAVGILAKLKKWGGSYRLCWWSFDKNSGVFTVIEFSNEEIEKINPEIVEILIP